VHDYSLALTCGETEPRHAVYLAEASVRSSSCTAGVFGLGHSRDTLDRRRLSAVLAAVDPKFKSGAAVERPFLELGRPEAPRPASCRSAMLTPLVLGGERSQRSFPFQAARTEQGRPTATSLPR
jgi:hypothetical protein